MGDLPAGWLAVLNSSGQIYFVHQATGYTSWSDPRSALGAAALNEAAVAGASVPSLGEHAEMQVERDPSFGVDNKQVQRQVSLHGGMISIARLMDAEFFMIMMYIRHIICIYYNINYFILYIINI